MKYASIHVHSTNAIDHLKYFKLHFKYQHFQGLILWSYTWLTFYFKSTNQDGLTYIEVSFTSNQSDRRPIIGAESKTDYVDIDFTRKAEPLPDDSD